MRTILKRLAARLPERTRQLLKQFYFARQIRKGRFRTSEPEYSILHQLVTDNDWVIDVGANVGHYTLRLAELVGTNGRVIAFEPIPATFALLVSNAAVGRLSNITMLNAAVGDEQRMVRMSIPKFEETGLDNFYMAQVNEAGPLEVLSLRIDALEFKSTVSLVKIDAEGHERSVLTGMSRLLERDHPTIIVEGNDDYVDAFLRRFGYSSRTLSGSPNRLYTVRKPGSTGYLTT